jgi:multidrug transporter EmrE-like cation transporter
VSAALIAMAADRAFADARVSTALLYAIVFVGIMTATLVLDLAVRAELRLRGAYALLAGISVVAMGFTGIDTEPRQFAFVSALLSMAETLGCELGQGFHLGRPHPAHEAVEPTVRVASAA